MDPAERNNLRRVVAGLLDHLAPGRDRRARILRVDHPARNLEGKPADTVAILPHHHDLALGRQRDDVYPGGRFKHEEIAFTATWMQ